MTPAEGGRVCGNCEKLIVDFRKKSWKEIETKQSENNNALCGMYSDKQLKHWGKEVPKPNFCSKNLLYASMVLSMNAAANQLYGKTNIQLPKSEIIQINQSIEKIKLEKEPHSDSLITITGKVIDEETKEPLIGVTLAIKNTVIGTITNVEGNFILKNISQKIITLQISYTGYETQEITLTERQRNQQKFVLNPVLLNSDAHISTFYVTVKRTPWQRFKSKIRGIFRRK